MAVKIFKCTTLEDMGWVPVCTFFTVLAFSSFKQ